MTNNLWVEVRLKVIRIKELKRDIAWGNNNKNKWWWDLEQERFHQMALEELEFLTKTDYTKKGDK